VKRRSKASSTSGTGPPPSSAPSISTRERRGGEPVEEAVGGRRNDTSCVNDSSSSRIRFADSSCPSNCFINCSLPATVVVVVEVVVIVDVGAEVEEGVVGVFSVFDAPSSSSICMEVGVEVVGISSFSFSLSEEEEEGVGGVFFWRGDREYCDANGDDSKEDGVLFVGVGKPCRGVGCWEEPSCFSSSLCVSRSRTIVCVYAMAA